MDSCGYRHSNSFDSFQVAQHSRPNGGSAIFQWLQRLSTVSTSIRCPAFLPRDIVLKSTQFLESWKSLAPEDLPAGLLITDGMSDSHVLAPFLSYPVFCVSRLLSPVVAI